MSSVAHASKPHCCPWWLGWLLVSPVRRWFLRPEELVDPILEPGNRVLEVGPGMGFFTLPIAKRIGNDGRVYCVDVQPAMLSGLARRIRRHGLESRVETRCCSSTSLDIGDLAGSIDVAVLAYVLHELPDPQQALREITSALRPNGRVLLIEPRGHVSSDQFATELRLTRDVGLVNISHPAITSVRRQQVALLGAP